MEKPGVGVLSVLGVIVIGALFFGSGLATEELEIYLPIIPYDGADWGVQIDGSVVDKGVMPYVVSDVTYQYPARWAYIEPNAPVGGVHTYNWIGPGTPRDPARDWLAENAQQLSGKRTIVGIKTSPQWARLWPEHLGSPPTESNYDNYAAAVNAIIDHTNHPWGVEIWNEPDTDCHEIEQAYGPNISEQFGCFHHGGESVIASGCRYGHLLAHTYAAMNNVHPDVYVIGGALMNFSDNPESYWRDFVAGVFNTPNNAGYGDCGYGLPKADYVSLHAYANYEDFPGNPVNIDEVLERAYYLFDLTGKQVIVSETAAKNYDNSNVHPLGLQEYQDQLAEYINNAWRLDRWRNGAASSKIVLFEWYGLRSIGWAGTDLIITNPETIKAVYDRIVNEAGHTRVMPYMPPTRIPTFTPTPGPTPTPGLSLPYPPPGGDGLEGIIQEGEPESESPYPVPYPEQ